MRSGIDSKLGPTMVSLQSGIAWAAEVWSATRTETYARYAAVSLSFWDLVKIGIPFTCALGNLYTNFDFSTIFVFESIRDRRMCKKHSAAYKMAA